MVLKVVSTPARFWERSARCFMGRFTLGLDETAAFFWRLGDWGVNLQERDRRIVYAIRIVVGRFSSATACFKKSCRRRLLEVSKQWGERASWCEEPEELRGALGGKRDLELSGFTVSWTPSTWPTHLSPPTTITVVFYCFQRGCVVVLYRCSPCTAVRSQ